MNVKDNLEDINRNLTKRQWWLSSTDSLMIGGRITHADRPADPQYESPAPLQDRNECAHSPLASLSAAVRAAGRMSFY